jgi:hypothetical protein
MSYYKTISENLIIFKDEKSYLNCRLDYLNYSGGVAVPDPTFFTFIQNGSYDSEKCEVESIIPVPAVPLNINDSSSPSWTYTTTIDTNSYSNTDAMTIDGDLIVSGNVFYNGELYSSHGVYEGTATSDHPISVKHNFEDSKPKDEEPDNPIDNRFDILDL